MKTKSIKALAVVGATVAILATSLYAPTEASAGPKELPPDPVLAFGDPIPASTLDLPYVH